MNAIVEEYCKTLRLSSVLKNYSAFAKDAQKQEEGYENYLKALLEEEVLQKEERKIKVLINRAKFPYYKRLSEFKFEESLSINPQEILGIEPHQYINLHKNICFLGQTGTGKTHLSIALGLDACEKGYSVAFFSAAHLVNELIEARSALSLKRFQARLAKIDLLIIDELGYLPFSKEGAELLFQLFADRYEKGSMIITSNLEFSKWSQFLSDSTMTSALLDRLTHHADIFTLIGESYRFKQRKKHSLNVD